MIVKTTKKEIRRIHSLRKLSAANAPKGQYFIGADNKAYMCDTPGMLGVKEVAEFQKKLKQQLTAQQGLL